MTKHAERQKTKLKTRSSTGGGRLPLSHRWLKMPQNERHSWAIRAMENVLNHAFAAGHDVRSQLSLVFGVRNKPEPDAAVVIGSFDDYKLRHPTTAVLAFEMSDSTLLQDRAARAAVYARAGIEEYRIVNLPDNVLEVRRQPAAMAEQPLGHHYRSIIRPTASDTVTPLAALDSRIAVTSLLP